MIAGGITKCTGPPPKLRCLESLLFSKLPSADRFQEVGFSYVSAHWTEVENGVLGTRSPEVGEVKSTGSGMRGRVAALTKRMPAVFLALSASLERLALKSRPIAQGDAHAQSQWTQLPLPPSLTNHIRARPTNLRDRTAPSNRSV